MVKLNELTAAQYLALSPAEKDALVQQARFEKGALKIEKVGDTWPILDSLNSTMQKTQGGFSVYTSATKGKNDQLGGINMLALVVNHGRGDGRGENMFLKLAPGKKANTFDVGKSECEAALQRKLAELHADYKLDVAAVEQALKAIQSAK